LNTYKLVAMGGTFDSFHKGHKILIKKAFEVADKVIIGPSGTGKSTLLRCINQLSPPDRGRVWLEGIEVTDKRTDINLETSSSRSA